MPVLRHIEYSKTERRLAAQARTIANVRDVLYHGTRYTQSILESRTLFRAVVGDQKVCLTRSAEVAAHWAMIRRQDDEGRGSILILDRRSLQRGYKINAVPFPYWKTKTIFHDEAEEEIWDDVVEVRSHLIDLVLGPKNGRLPMMNHGTSRRVLAAVRKEMDLQRMLNPPVD